MAISEEFLSQLRDRTDIEDLLSSYITLKRRGKNLVGLCPFHNEKTPSFTVYPDNGSFYCFGCGAGGDAITFVRRIENLDYVDAVKFLAQRAGLRMPEDGVDDTLSKRRQRILAANREAARFFHAQLLDEANRHALSYFAEKRALSMQTIRHFGLGYAPGSWDALLRHMQKKGFSASELFDANLVWRSKNSENSYFDAFRNRVMVPIIDTNGNVIAFGGRVLDDSKPKYLNTTDTLVYKKSKALFGLNFAKATSQKQMILCEGYMDVIALHQFGFENSVAGCGTALTQDQAQLISRYTKEVLLSYDGDEAGQKALAKAIDVFSSIGMKVKVLHLSGGKDPDEILRKYGKERFRAIVEGAANDVEFRILALRDKYDVQSDDGKVQFFREAIEVLATIEDPIELDIYASRLADEMTVDKSAILAQVTQTVRTRQRRRSREKMEQLQRDLMPRRDELNPEMRDHPRAGKAEEGILSLLIENNDFIQKVRQVVSPDSFVTSFHRRVYSQLLKCCDETGVVDIQHLSAYFDPQELGRVTGIHMKHSIYANTLEACMDCVATLLEEKQKLSQDKPSIDSDDAFLSSFQALKEKKQ